MENEKIKLVVNWIQDSKFKKVYKKHQDNNGIWYYDLRHGKRVVDWSLTTRKKKLTELRKRESNLKVKKALVEEYTNQAKRLMENIEIEETNLWMEEYWDLNETEFKFIRDNEEYFDWNKIEEKIMEPIENQLEDSLKNEFREPIGTISKNNIQQETFIENIKANKIT